MCVNKDRAALLLVIWMFFPFLPLYLFLFLNSSHCFPLFLSLKAFFLYCIVQNPRAVGDSGAESRVLCPSYSRCSVSCRTLAKAKPPLRSPEPLSSSREPLVPCPENPALVLPGSGLCLPTSGLGPPTLLPESLQLSLGSGRTQELLSSRAWCVTPHCGPYGFFSVRRVNLLPIN